MYGPPEEVHVLGGNATAARGLVTAAKYVVPESRNPNPRSRPRGAGMGGTSAESEEELWQRVPVRVAQDDATQQQVALRGLLYSSHFKLKQAAARAAPPASRHWPPDHLPTAPCRCRRRGRIRWRGGGPVAARSTCTCPRTAARRRRSRPILWRTWPAPSSRSSLVARSPQRVAVPLDRAATAAPPREKPPGSPSAHAPQGATDCRGGW